MKALQDVHGRPDIHNVGVGRGNQKVATSAKTGIPGSAYMVKIMVGMRPVGSKMDL